MRLITILILAGLTVAGCASSGAKLPVCDGWHVRPANPHGSVLDPATPAADTAAPAAGAEHPGCGR